AARRQPGAQPFGGPRVVLAELERHRIARADLRAVVGEPQALGLEHQPVRRLHAYAAGDAAPPLLHLESRLVALHPVRTALLARDHDLDPLEEDDALAVDRVAVASNGEELPVSFRDG